MAASTDKAQQDDIIAAAIAFARDFHEKDDTGHDWWHIQRVSKMTERLAEAEGANRFVALLAALLHDVADEKLNESKESGLRRVQSWLESQPVAAADCGHVIEIISTMSYNAGLNPPMRTLEGQVVQDADRLDAIGAIAIARCFLYAGKIGDPIHDPGIKPRDSITKEQYRNEGSTAINHFYEKLLKLKDRINTPSAKAIAEERHRYMERYVTQFHAEWDGLL
ncbi:HD domain-containing protein [Paenibacillus sp. 1011MAR3C5]|uniref:HD domain-containing protein n=1 Tax=Paenibacillus sp. 1011MAR3C5 TaxID=1675787 RepID=UPI000E6CC186|nr:HD domain-containing protein [Paenibacillus sp. 1011MAR3C5]RJE88492.1 HD domain-containing protein [Paenibacillus sp. 1011MAR3C5]